MNRELNKLFISLTLLLVCATGCSPVVELAVGHKIGNGTFNSSEGGDNPTFTGRIRQDLSKHLFVEYEHISHIKNGKPFNDEPELYVDQLNVGVRFGLWGH